MKIYNNIQFLTNTWRTCMNQSQFPYYLIYIKEVKSSSNSHMYSFHHEYTEFHRNNSSDSSHLPIYETKFHLKICTTEDDIFKI